MQQDNIPFTRTHDLTQLLRDLLPGYPELKPQLDNLEWLTTYAVEIRYPGEAAIEQDARKSVAIMENVIPILIDKLE